MQLKLAKFLWRLNKIEELESDLFFHSLLFEILQVEADYALCTNYITYCPERLVLLVEWLDFPTGASNGPASNRLYLSSSRYLNSKIVLNVSGWSAQSDTLIVAPFCLSSHIFRMCPCLQLTPAFSSTHEQRTLYGQTSHSEQCTLRWN